MGSSCSTPMKMNCRDRERRESSRSTAISGRRPKATAASGRHSARSAIFITPTSYRSISRSTRAWRSGRNASALLHRPDAYDAARGAGADPPLVAHDLFPGVQGAARGQDPCFSAGRAVRASPRLCRKRRLSTSFRCQMKKPPSARCNRAAFTKAAPPFRGRRNGRRRPTPCSTEPTAACSARRRKRARRP